MVPKKDRASLRLSIIRLSLAQNDNRDYLKLGDAITVKLPKCNKAMKRFN
jgi:exosome complex RNA-binding protein Rrp4